MTPVFTVQWLLPLALLLWMLIAPPRSRLGWGLQLVASLLVPWAMARAAHHSVL